MLVETDAKSEVISILEFLKGLCRGGKGAKAMYRWMLVLLFGNLV